MTPRSPLRASSLPVAFGSELPVVLRHHRHRRSYALTRGWRPAAPHGVMNKPVGGVWGAVAWAQPGKWRPIPRRSAWAAFCESALGEAPPWVTVIHPDPHASFARIDSSSEAAAWAAAYPGELEGEVRLARAFGISLPFAEGGIDWTRLLSETGLAGVWLTARGRVETRLPEGGSPSLDGWDVESVWFGRRAFRVGATRAY